MAAFELVQLPSFTTAVIELIQKPSLGTAAIARFKPVGLGLYFFIFPLRSHSSRRSDDPAAAPSPALILFSPSAPPISPIPSDFFTDRLWESVDKDWIDCLRNEPVHNLLQIPSGVVQVKMN